jgi:hypothetical protein
MFDVIIRWSALLTVPSVSVRSAGGSQAHSAGNCPNLDEEAFKTTTMLIIDEHWRSSRLNPTRVAVTLPSFAHDAIVSIQAGKGLGL